MSQRNSVGSSVSPHPKASTPTCTRCNSSIISGHAYELGGDRWHTHCFTCYKCDKKLTCKSDFLVLGTGTLICFSCSDSCKGCGKKIDDLAIILSSSNEAYCSNCFKCCKCTKRIDDLRYAKTRRGLFCISCHEKLLAKRKHAEEKKRRLQKELPSVPSQTSLSSYITTPEADSKKIPQCSAQRPVSPRKMGDYVVSDSAHISSESSKQTSPTTESQGNTAPSNTSDRRSSDMETIGTKNLLDSAASIDRKLTSSVDSSTTTFETSIKSNSWSVVAQFLEDDDDETSEYTTTGDTAPMRDEVRSSVGSFTPSVSHLEERRPRAHECHNNRKPEEKKRLHPPDESIDKTVIDQRHMTSGNNRDEQYDAGTPKRHTRNYSLDDVLQRTLTKDDNDNDNPRIIEGLALPTGQKQRRALLNRTPLRNKDDPLLSKSPVSHRRGFIMSESGEFINELLSSPSSVGILSGETDMASSTGKPDVAHSYTAKTVEQGVDQDSSVSCTYKPSNNSKSPKLENPPYLLPEQQSNFVTSLSSTSLDPKHAKSLSGFSNSIGNANGSTLNHKSSSKLTRSTSVRSKVANLIHGKKSLGSARSMQQDTLAFDTHTGWGVSAGIQGQGISPLKSNTGSKVSPHGRGQSDSTIYSQVSPKLAKKQTFDHSRSQSGMTGSNIAVHITPPISANASPMCIMPISKIDGIFPEERTPTNDEFIRRDLVNEDLLMRQLRLEVNDLQNNKLQLTAEVDHLKKYREQLKSQIEQLKAERKDLSAGSSDSLEDDQNVAVKQVVTATASSHAKPRFWKLFGGKPAFSNANSGSSSSGANVSGSPFNISHPVLQNPNEFDDWNLKTINSGSELYGSSLVARVAYEGNDLPMIVTTCLNHIESKTEYLTSEGLYRKSGSQLLIEQIENEFIQWQPEEPVPDRIYESLSQDIHAVSSVLKRYLRKLPNPLFTFQVYEPLMQIVREERLCTTAPLKNSKKNSLYRTIVNMLVNVLKLLPTEHLRLLKVICQHVNLVAQYQQANLMNMNNLALVFAPGIIRDYSGEKDITDMKERNYLVGFVFINYEDIFASLYTV